MTYYKAVFNLNRPVARKAPEERKIYSKMSANPFFADAPVPYTDFSNALKEQGEAVKHARFGGHIEVASMHSKVRIVDDMMRKYRTFVSLKADGDKDLILSSGFNHTKPRTKMGDMPKVEDVKKLNSEVSGTLKLKWKRVENVAFYEVEVREVEALPNDAAYVASDVPGAKEMERKWVPTSTRPARIVIENLKPLTRYEVRVRAKGTKGYGGYSNVVIMLVI